MPVTLQSFPRVRPHGLWRPRAYGFVCLRLHLLRMICMEKCTSDIASLPQQGSRRHGESEPRSVGVLVDAHGMTLLLQRTKTTKPQLHNRFTAGSPIKVFWSPSGTLCPKARGLSPQHIWEQAPCMLAAWPCFSCLPTARLRHPTTVACTQTSP